MFDNLQLQFDNTDDFIRQEPFLVTSSALVLLTIGMIAATWITKQPYLGFYGAICLVGAIAGFRRWCLFRQMLAEVGISALLAGLYLRMSLPALFH